MTVAAGFTQARYRVSTAFMMSRAGLHAAVSRVRCCSTVAPDPGKEAFAMNPTFDRSGMDTEGQAFFLLVEAAYRDYRAARP